MIKANVEVENFGIALIFDEKVLYKTPFVVNYGWMGGTSDNSIYIDPNTSNESNVTEELKNIYEKISDKKLTDYELLVRDSLPIDNLIAIHCPGCSKQKIKKIKKLLRKNQSSVKIYTDKRLIVTI